MKTLKEFLVSKEITMDAFKEMSAEEQAGLMNEHMTAQKESFDALVKEGKATKEELETFKTQMQEEREEERKILNSTLKEMGLAIKKLTETEKEEISNSPSLKEALKANLENLKALKDGSRNEAKEATFDLTINKVVGNMTIAANVTGGNIPVEDRIEGLNIIPSRPVRVLDVMAKRGTTSNVVSWVEQANKDGAAGQTAEGTAKNQIDFDLVVANENVKKTTAFIKVSTEMLDDIDWIESEINNELMRELMKEVEAQAYEGDGIGQNHNGIRTQASAFSVTGIEPMDNANIVDVLAVAANQIKVAQEMGAMPSAIFMHPTDLVNLKLVKVTSTDKRYVERLTEVAGTLRMDGIPILESTLVTVGEYLIGDFSKSILVERQGTRVEIGLDGNDFTNNFRTILAEWRGLTLIKGNDTSAFVAGVFATDIAALDAIV